MIHRMQYDPKALDEISRSIREYILQNHPHGMDMSKLIDPCKRIEAGKPIVSALLDHEGLKEEVEVLRAHSNKELDRREHDQTA